MNLLKPRGRPSLRPTALLLTALPLAACSMAPAYVRPAPPVPDALPQGGAYPALAAGEGSVETLGWSAFVTDARLRRVIATALAQNRDLRATIANVAAARAQYRITRAAQFPTLTATPSASRFHGAVSSSGYVGGGGDTPATTSDAYGIAGGVTAFEIDLWGRVRNQSRAALETWLASEEGRKSAQITLVGEVAQAWLTLAADADALAIARETLASRETSLGIMRQGEANGVGTALEVAQAEALRDSARADVAAYVTTQAQALNALTLLVGAAVPAQDLPTGLGEDGPVLHSLPVGLSSAVLLRRPDVLAAEHRLRAANADIGAARAALFPTISLTGLLGLASGSLSGLFDQGGTWRGGIAASATQTLFDGGAKANALGAARAARDAAVAQYEGAVQGAFADVANALARRGTIDEQLSAQSGYVVNAERAATISQSRYRNGIDTWLTALDAARTAYAARQGLVSVRLAREINMVTLYQVLGGGLVP